LIGWLLTTIGGIPSGIISFFLAKAMGFAGAIALHYYNSKNNYYYFRNSGFSMRSIFAAAFATDILLYFFLITIASLV
jgi:hypothetical protein